MNNTNIFKKLGTLILILTIISVFAGCEGNNEKVVIQNVGELANVSVPYGTSSDDVISQLPSTVEVTLSNNQEKTPQLAWEASENYDATKAGTYQFSGSFTVQGLSDSVEVDVTVLEEEIIVESVSAIDETLTVGDDYTLPTTVDVNVEGEDEAVEMEVEWDGTVDTTEAGEFTFEGTLTLSEGYVNPDEVTATANITVEEEVVPDTTAPVITLNGEESVTVEYGEEYVDAGATATDAVDGEVEVVVTNLVDTSSVGSYTVTYTAVDAAGNEATATRIVEVVDVTAPVIRGVEDITLAYDSDFESMTGVTASDDVDGDLTDSIVVDNPVDTSVPGDYTVAFTVSDAAGNEETATMAVKVLENPEDYEEATPEAIESKIESDNNIELDSVTGDFVLSDSMRIANKLYNVSWESSNANVIYLNGEDAVVNRPQGDDVVVTLTGTFDLVQEFTIQEDDPVPPNIVTTDVTVMGLWTLDDLEAVDSDTVTATFTNGETHTFELDQALEENVATEISFSYREQDFDATLTWEVATPTLEVKGIEDGISTNVADHELAVNSDADEVVVTLDGTEVTASEHGNYDISFDEEKEYTITVEATNEGVVSAEPVELTATYDVTPPVAPEVEGVEDEGFYNTAVTPKFNVGSATLDDTEFVSGTEVAETGSHTLVVTTSDAAGNEATTAVTFTLDLVAPEAPTSSLTPDTYSEAQYVELSAEEGATIYYTLDGTEPTLDSNVYDGVINIDQDTTIKAIAGDQAGNLSNVASFFYDIDSTLNDLALVADVAEVPEQGGPVTYTATLTDNNEDPLTDKEVSFAIVSEVVEGTVLSATSSVTDENAEATVQLTLAESQTATDIEVQASWMDLEENVTVTVTQVVGEINIVSPIYNSDLADPFTLELQMLDIVGQPYSTTADLYLTFTEDGTSLDRELTAVEFDEDGTCSLEIGTGADVDVDVAPLDPTKIDSIDVATNGLNDEVSRLNNVPALALPADTDVGQGETVELTASLNAPALANEEIAFAITTAGLEAGTTLSQETVVTDNNGEAKIELTVDETEVEGTTIAIQATWRDQSDTIEYNVNQVAQTVEIVSPITNQDWNANIDNVEIGATDKAGDSLTGNFDAKVTINYYDADADENKVIEGTGTFNFVAGSFDAPLASIGYKDTEDNPVGLNTVNTNAVQLTVALLHGAGADAVEVATDDVSDLNTDKSMEIIAEQASSAQGGTVELTATLKIDDEPVAGEEVTFELAGNSSDDTALAVTSGTTDANGELATTLNIADGEDVANNINVTATWSWLDTITDNLDANLEVTQAISTLEITEPIEWQLLADPFDLTLNTEDLFGEAVDDQTLDADITFIDNDASIQETKNATISFEAGEDTVIVGTNLADDITLTSVDIADIDSIQVDILDQTNTVNELNVPAELTIDSVSDNINPGGTVDFTATLTVNENPIEGQEVSFDLVGAGYEDDTILADAMPVVVETGSDGTATVTLNVADTEDSDITVSADWDYESGTRNKHTEATVTLETELQTLDIINYNDWGNVNVDANHQFGIDIGLTDSLGNAYAGSTDVSITFTAYDGTVETETLLGVDFGADVIGEATLIVGEIPKPTNDILLNNMTVDEILNIEVTVDTLSDEVVKLNLAPVMSLSVADDATTILQGEEELNFTVDVVDKNDNPVADAVIDFSLAGNGKNATTLDKDKVTTGADGKATVKLTVAIDEPVGNTLDITADWNQVAPVQTETKSIDVKQAVTTVEIQEPDKWDKFAEGLGSSFTIYATDLFELPVESDNVKAIFTLTQYVEDGADVVDEYNAQIDFNNGTNNSMIVNDTQLIKDIGSWADVNEIKVEIAGVKSEAVAEINPDVEVALTPETPEVDQGGEVEFVAQLKINGVAIAGEEVDFALAGDTDTSLGASATTDENGEAAVMLDVGTEEPAGDNMTVTATWTGPDAQNYESSEVTVTVNPVLSELSITPVSGTALDSNFNLEIILSDGAGDDYVQVGADEVIATEVVFTDLNANVTDTYDFGLTGDDFDGNKAIIAVANADTDADINLVLDATNITDVANIHEITVNAADLTATVDELNSYEVTFDVTESGDYQEVSALVAESIQDAEVVLGNFDSITTNANGEVVFTDVPSGTYSYTVTHTDFYKVTGEVTVNANETEAVSMNEDKYIQSASVSTLSSSTDNQTAFFHFTLAGATEGNATITIDLANLVAAGVNFSNATLTENGNGTAEIVNDSIVYTADADNADNDHITVTVNDINVAMNASGTYDVDFTRDDTTYGEGQYTETASTNINASLANASVDPNLVDGLEEQSQVISVTVDGDLASNKTITISVYNNGVTYGAKDKWNVTGNVRITDVTSDDDGNPSVITLISDGVTSGTVIELSTQSVSTNGIADVDVDFNRSDTSVVDASAKFSIQ